ncbi:MAG: PIN domain-containing protein [Acidobacteria bacterium]|nr:PIN domain-containing protein [Acidobacteriota bacterium]
MSMYVTDTHPLIYYRNRVVRRLSARARTVFEQAENGEALILIPAPVLWEVSMLEKAEHITLNQPYAEWVKDLLQNRCFDCVPLDASIIAESRDYSFNNDIFDAVIVATAKLQDLPLITRDVAITNSGVVEICW